MFNCARSRRADMFVVEQEEDEIITLIRYTDTILEFQFAARTLFRLSLFTLARVI